MAIFSLKTVLSTALLVAHSALAIPTPVEHEPLAARATVTETPAATITPEIIDHGPLDEASLEELIKNKTSTILDKILPRQNTGTSINGGFLSYMKGLDMPGNNPKCPEFLVEGPILGLQAAMGSTNIRSFHLTSIAGNSTDIKGLENIVDPPPGPFEFGANERVTEFVVYEGGEQVMGFTFKTDAGKEYKALSEGAENPANNVVLNSIPVGSGIIARIRGTNCDVGVLGAFGIDFLDELASIAITNTTYSGFTNNIAPAGDGSFLNVGSQVLDNRNGSVQQQMTLTTADAITQSRTITTTSSWFVGGGVTAKASAGLPFIGKTELETTANWQVAGGSDDAELTSQTSTRTATFQLNCPAKKYCVGAAVFQVFKLDINMEATFTAETKSGNKYSWVQKGTYKGSDSLSMKLTVDEVDNV